MSDLSFGRGVLDYGIPEDRRPFSIGSEVDATGEWSLFVCRNLLRLSSRQINVYRDLLPLANKLGLIFQIRDDYQNLQSKKYTDNKVFCEDLSEGKFSFLIIHSIRSNPNDHQLLNILRQRSTEYSVKCHAVRYMESTDSFSYCRKKLLRLAQEARNMVDEIMVDGLGDEILRLLDYLDLSEE